MSERTADYSPAEHPKDLTDQAFRVGLWGKFINGSLECIGGILLLIVSPELINKWAVSLTEGELSRNPNDFIANRILNTAHELTGSSLIFGAAYLLSHGIIKLVLVVEVWRNRLWAYIGLIVVTALFIVYQVYRIIDDFTWFMFWLTIFDLIIIYLTQKEYRRHKAHREASAS